MLYSGTVAAAIEGAFFGITSVAVSLEYDEQARFDKAAKLAVPIIEQILAQKDAEPQLYNLNIPLAALDGPAEVRVVPMCVAPWGEEFERRNDPRGRAYYWATGRQPVPPATSPTDLSELRAGHITLTPLRLRHDASRQARRRCAIGSSARNACTPPPTRHNRMHAMHPGARAMSKLFLSAAALVSLALVGCEAPELRAPPPASLPRRAAAG